MWLILCGILEICGEIVENLICWYLSIKRNKVYKVMINSLLKFYNNNKLGIFIFRVVKDSDLVFVLSW